MTDHPLPITPPPNRPRAAVVVLGVLVVLLVGASAGAVVLFAGARQDRVLEVQHLDQTSQTLAETKDRLAATSGTNDQVAELISTLEAQNAVLHRCADPARDGVVAARDGDDAALGPAVSRTTDNC